MPYFLFLGLASGFFFSGSGIFTCAKPETASSKLSGCNDIGSPALPFGFVGSFFTYPLTLRSVQRAQNTAQRAQQAAAAKFLCSRMLALARRAARFLKLTLRRAVATMFGKRSQVKCPTSTS